MSSVFYRLSTGSLIRQSLSLHVRTTKKSGEKRRINISSPCSQRKNTDFPVFGASRCDPSISNKPLIVFSAGEWQASWGFYVRRFWGSHVGATDWLRFPASECNVSTGLFREGSKGSGSRSRWWRRSWPQPTDPSVWRWFCRPGLWPLTFEAFKYLRVCPLQSSERLMENIQRTFLQLTHPPVTEGPSPSVRSGGSLKPPSGQKRNCHQWVPITSMYTQFENQ